MSDELTIKYKIILELLRFSHDINKLDLEAKKRLLENVVLANILEELYNNGEYDKVISIMESLDVRNLFESKFDDNDREKLQNNTRTEAYYRSMASFVKILSFVDLYHLYNLLFEGKDLILK